MRTAFVVRCCAQQSILGYAGNVQHQFVRGHESRAGNKWTDLCRMRASPNRWRLQNDMLSALIAAWQRGGMGAAYHDVVP